MNSIGDGRISEAMSPSSRLEGVKRDSSATGGKARLADSGRLDSSEWVDLPLISIVPCIGNKGELPFQLAQRSRVVIGPEWARLEEQLHFVATGETGRVREYWPAEYLGRW